MTWGLAVVAYKPVNFLRSDWNKAGPHAPSVGVRHFGLKWLPPGIECQTTVSTLPYIIWLPEPHPLCNW